MSLTTTFVPLSFITSKDEILHQIKNSIMFSYLLDKYEETTLSNYLESTQYGYTASALDTGDHRLVRITDIKNGIVDWNLVPYCDCDSEEKYLLTDGDILIARTGGTTGKSFVVQSAPENAVFASYLIRLRFKNNVNQEFIVRFLNSYTFWSQIIEMKSGSAMPNVNAEKLKTLVIPKVSYENQNAILQSFFAEMNKNELSSIIQKTEQFYNTSIENNNELSKQLDLVKQLRQAFLREAMQGKLVPQDPNDEPASNLLKKIKAEKEKLIKEGKLKKQKPLPPITKDEIPFEIPENWVWCRLGEICEKIGSGSTPKGSNYSNEGMPFFRSQNIHDTGLVYDDIKFISLDVHKKMNGTTVYANDVLLNITGGSLGRTALVPSDFNEGNVSQHVCIVRPIRVNNSFIHRLILSPIFQQYIFKSTTGAGREGLPKYNLEQFVIPIPPLFEQQRIVAKLDELMSYCDQLEESIKQSQTQNEQLLQQVLKDALNRN